MDRKAFLKAAILPEEKDPPKKSDPIAARYENQEMPLELSLSKKSLVQYSGTWGTAQVAHLLRRSTFGFKKTALASFTGLGVGGSVDALLNVSATPPSSPVNNYEVGGYVDPTGVPPGATWVNAAYGDGTVNFKRRQSLKSWWQGLQINQDDNLREKMTLFWHNHFATETNTIGDARFMYKHHALIRSYALGNFKSLVKDITLDPGMLIYLNGYVNTKNAPDENYARELMELFTLGKGADSQYTEDDVKAAARVLTGWRINPTSLISFFDSSKHDTVNKSFSPFFNNTVITGQSGSAGANETDDLLNMIFQKEDVVARFICRKLYRFFVYYVISSDVEQNVIIPLANTFRSNNWEIKPVLDELFRSQHFYDSLNMGCQIKSPADFLVGLHRQCSIQIPAAPVEDQYAAWSAIVNTGAQMSQDLGDPPNVAGWPAYYQEPQYYELWINSDTLPKRNAHSSQYYSSNGFRYSTGKYMVIDPIAFAKQSSDPANPNQLIADCITILMSADLSSTQKDYLKSILLAGQSQDHYWSDAWNAYIAAPADPVAVAAVKTKLQAMLKYMMELPEYQLS